MNELQYTLVTDGSSDATLIPILTWLLRENGIRYAIQSQWADLRQIRTSKKRSLKDRIYLAYDLYPCELLFIHWDAEREPLQSRKDQISVAVKNLSIPPHICVIPVRMLEAWLLFDENTIRHASGNTVSRQPLNLPPISGLEKLPNPKRILYESLKIASNLRGRRLERFHFRRAAARVTEFLENFSPLRSLSAFNILEAEIKNLIKTNGWNNLS